MITAKDIVCSSLRDDDARDVTLTARLHLMASVRVADHIAEDGMTEATAKTQLAEMLRARLYAKTRTDAAHALAVIRKAVLQCETFNMANVDSLLTIITDALLPLINAGAEMLPITRDV